MFVTLGASYFEIFWEIAVNTPKPSMNVKMPRGWKSFRDIIYKLPRHKTKLTDFEEEANSQYSENHSKNRNDGNRQDVRVAEKEVLRVVARIPTDFVRVHDGWNE